MSVCRSDDIRLEWQRLGYKVESTRFNWKKLKYIDTTVNVLKDVSGSVSAGQLVAIVGPSGSGKTTLLAAISQRLRGNISGNVLVNGALVGRKEMSDRSSFIPQFDVSSEFLTVYEHMSFMYKLKNCSALGPQHAYIYGILRSLGLSKVALSRISVLSGGEKKKLLLATELLIDPSIIFCDEPTTGLDSYNALSVLSSMQQLVGYTEKINEDKEKRSHMNKLVICSIHQPSSEVFACFSHVILMQEGRIAFQGTVLEAENFFSRFLNNGLNEYSIIILEYFVSYGFICPPAFNRADFFVNKLSVKTYDINHNISTNHRKAATSSTVENIEMCYTKAKCSNYELSKRHVSWMYQVFMLTHMLTVGLVRNIKEFIYKIITFIVTALFVALLYGGSNDVDQTAIQDINGFVQNMANEIILATAYNVVFYYPSKLPLLRRETGEGKYSLSAFYVAYLLSSMPKSFIECFVFLGIVFPFTNFLRGIWLFLKMALTLSIISIPATAYGLMLSGLFESSMVATSLAAPFDVVLMVTGGIYIKLKLLWFLKYVSVFYYACEALSIIIWKQANVLSCAPAVYNACFTTGSEVLESLFYETSYLFLWVDFAGLIATAMVMNTIGFLGIQRMVNKSGFY